MAEPIRITASQGNALYDQILSGLSRSGDIWEAVQARRFEEAERLFDELSDDMALIRDGLGWGDGDGGEVEFKVAPDVLRRALSRNCLVAVKRDAMEIPDRVEMRENKKRNAEVVSACRRVLAELDRTEERWGSAEL